MIAKIYKAGMVLMGAALIVGNLWARGDGSIDGLGIAGILIVVTIGLIGGDIDAEYKSAPRREHSGEHIYYTTTDGRRQGGKHV